MLPIYELVLEKETDGVQLVSFVENPAMKAQWVAFSESNPVMFNVVSEEKRIVTGAILLADFPVLRIDENGNPFYVLLRAETIEAVAQKFFKEGYHKGSNKDHNKDEKVENTYMFESYIIDRERGINPPKGFEEMAKDGSWFGSYKIEDESTWMDAKSGKFNGFSIEGMFGMKPINFKSETQAPKEDEQLLNALISLDEALNIYLKS
jgi:hypothetical protein